MSYTRTPEDLAVDITLELDDDKARCFVHQFPQKQPFKYTYKPIEPKAGELFPSEETTKEAENAV
jgi:hypothetical protein